MCTKDQGGGQSTLVQAIFSRTNTISVNCRYKYNTYSNLNWNVNDLLNWVGLWYGYFNLDWNLFNNWNWDLDGHMDWNWSIDWDVHWVVALLDDWVWLGDMHWHLDNLLDRHMYDPLNWVGMWNTNFVRYWDVLLYWHVNVFFDWHGVWDLLDHSEGLVLFIAMMMAVIVSTEIVVTLTTKVVISMTEIITTKLIEAALVLTLAGLSRWLHFFGIFSFFFFLVGGRLLVFSCYTHEQHSKCGCDYLLDKKSKQTKRE